MTKLTLVVDGRSDVDINLTGEFLTVNESEFVFFSVVNF